MAAAMPGIARQRAHSLQSYRHYGYSRVEGALEGKRVQIAAAQRYSVASRRQYTG